MKMKRQGIQKDLYWQMIRGICILAVIMIHCPSGQGYSTLDYHTWIILRQVINFPVAIFVFLSGYFMTAEKTYGDYKIFLLRRGGIDFFFHTYSGAVCI